MATSCCSGTFYATINVLGISTILLAFAASTSAGPVVPRQADSATVNFNKDVFQLLMNTHTQTAVDQQPDPMVFTNLDYANFVSQVCDLVAYAGVAETLLANGLTAQDENLTRLLSAYQQRISAIANNTCEWAMAAPTDETVQAGSAFADNPCSPESMYHQCFSMRILSPINTVIYDAVIAGQNFL